METGVILSILRFNRNSDIESALLISGDDILEHLFYIFNWHSDQIQTEIFYSVGWLKTALTAMLVDIIQGYFPGRTLWQFATGNLLDPGVLGLL